MLLCLSLAVWATCRPIALCVLELSSVSIVDSWSILYNSGSRNGSIHLWTVQGKCPSDLPESEPRRSEHKGPVTHVTCLEGHPAPITSLVIDKEACVLASGCKAGSVRVWDLYVRYLSVYLNTHTGHLQSFSDNITIIIVIIIVAKWHKCQLKLSLTQFFCFFRALNYWSMWEDL